MGIWFDQASHKAHNVATAIRRQNFKHLLALFPYGCKDPGNGQWLRRGGQLAHATSIKGGNCVRRFSRIFWSMTNFTKISASFGVLPATYNTGSQGFKDNWSGSPPRPCFGAPFSTFTFATFYRLFKSRICALVCFCKAFWHVSITCQWNDPLPSLCKIRICHKGNLVWKAQSQDPQ